MCFTIGETTGAIADFTTAIISDAMNAATFEGRGKAKQNNIQKRK
jgi:hypothetical protein